MLVGLAVAAALLLPSSGAAKRAGPESEAAGAPVVMFPAYFFTTLRVTVHHQTVAPECPSSGSFRVFFLNDEPSAFSKVCQQKLLTLRYEDNRQSRCACGSRSTRCRRPDRELRQDRRARRSTSRCTRRSRRPATRATATSGWPATTRGSPPTWAASSTGRSALIEDDLPRQRRTAGPPGRPLERADLRPVPAHPHEPAPGRTSTSTASRRSPATSRARARSTR